MLSPWASSAQIDGERFRHGRVTANGIEIHFVEQGEGPLVLFLHGFPESWYSWRHQMPVVAAADYRAVALDMRGYGQSSKPEAIASYSISHLVGDVIGTVTALGYDQAVIVGHDWGGPVAWYSVLMRPHVVRAVAVLSVPFNPPTSLPESVTLNDVMRANAAGRNYYRLYFQEPGAAEAELEADVRHSTLGFLYSISGDIVSDGIHSQGWDGYFPRNESLADQLVIPSELPVWLSQTDLEFYVNELTRTGFRGGLNWHRNISAIPGILAPFVGTTVVQPALYLYGEHELIAGNTDAAVNALPSLLPNLRGVVRLEGAGHWLQQERPHEVNEALLEFLADL